MAPNFDALQDQLTRLAQLAISIPVEERSFHVSELIALAARPLEEQLTGPHAALEFAAREIGSAMIALAGFKSLHVMFDRLEQDVGEQEAMWVCRSWVGLQSGTGSTWSD